MCVCSFLGQVVFGALMLTALGLTLAALLTPGWQEVKGLSSNKDDATQIGLFSCKQPSVAQNVNVPSSVPGGFPATNSAFCDSWWDNQPTEMKAVIACLCLAVVVEVIAIAWTIFTICACCCKQCLVQPLPALAFVAAILLAIAVGIYGAQNRDSIVPPPTTNASVNTLIDSSFSYSFYLACGAMAISFASGVVGVLTVLLAKTCL